MLWLILAGGAAFFEAGKDIWHSQQSVANIKPVVKAFTVSTISLPVLVAILAYHTAQSGLPMVKPGFWLYVTIHAVLLSIAFILYMRALAIGLQSVTQPILALTTVFLVVTTPLMTNDHVTVWGWLGVLAVGVGIYATSHPGKVVEKDRAGKVLKTYTGVFAPFRAMFDQPGVGSKFGVAIIFSVTANLDKLCLERSSGPFYLVVDQVMVAAILGTVILVYRLCRWPLTEVDKETGERAKIKPARLYLVGGGFINAVTVSLHMWALTFVPVPYVIAVKRLSIAFVSLWSYIVRKERRPSWYRIAGLALVVIGIAVMLLLGKEAGRG